jgi:hypothetical protein
MFWFGKIKKHLFSAFALLWLLVSSCSKTDFPELKDNGTGFDPATEKDQVNRVLQVRGSYFDNLPLPAKSEAIQLNSFTFRIPRPYIIHDWRDSINKLDSVEIGNEMQAFIPIKISEVEFGQYFKPINIFMKVSGANGYWKIPYSSDSSNAGGYFTIVVPSLVREGSFTLTLSAELQCVLPGYNSIKVFTDSVNLFLNVRPAVGCGSIISGTSGLSIRKIDFGAKAKRGKVRLSFVTGTIPDRFDLRINGRYVASSCPSMPKSGHFPLCSEYPCFIFTGMTNYEFEYNPADGRFGEVFVMGWCQDPRTIWYLTIGCPE